MHLAHSVVQLAYDPGITPNEGGLPGLSVLKRVMGSVNLFGIIAVVGSMAVSAGVWAWGHHSGGHQAEANGKKGVLVSAGAALLLGAANGIVGEVPPLARGRRRFSPDHRPESRGTPAGAGTTCTPRE